MKNPLASPLLGSRYPFAIFAGLVLASAFPKIGLAGMASLLFGAFFAIFQHDLKGLLAYSTISHLGLITMLFGMGELSLAVFCRTDVT